MRECCDLRIETVTAKADKKSAPIIKVPVTAGNLRNGHVYLREFLWFFPKGAIRRDRGEADQAVVCELSLPGVGTIETDIDADKAIFRWRGWRKFFRLHHVSEGDLLVFSRNNGSKFSVGVEHNVLEGLDVVSSEPGKEVGRGTKARRPRRCNDLSGNEWLRYSLSVWSDVKKSAEEVALRHPAMFPAKLCERLMLMFLRRRGKDRVLDPFMGSGSTLVAARSLGKVGIGLEINPDYVSMAKRRLESPSLLSRNAPGFEIHQADARQVLDYVKPNSIDFCLTSPPYWDILNQKRTADNKAIRNYGDLDGDLSNVRDYAQFVQQLADVFSSILCVLRPSAYCVVVVMDLRKKNRFYPFHSDLARALCEKGFMFDDLIIWDRKEEYNNLRPLGYPSVFRVNKVHEFVLIFKKPSD